jgi:hypothetical protein
MKKILLILLIITLSLTAADKKSDSQVRLLKFTTLKGAENIRNFGNDTKVLQKLQAELFKLLEEKKDASQVKLQIKKQNQVIENKYQLIPELNYINIVENAQIYKITPIISADQKKKFNKSLTAQINSIEANQKFKIELQKMQLYKQKIGDKETPLQELKKLKDLQKKHSEYMFTTYEMDSSSHYIYEPVQSTVFLHVTNDDLRALAHILKSQAKTSEAPQKASIPATK